MKAVFRFTIGAHSIQGHSRRAALLRSASVAAAFWCSIGALGQQTEKLEVELVGEWRATPSRSVAVSGNYAYVTSGQVGSSTAFG